MVHLESVIITSVIDSHLKWGMVVVYLSEAYLSSKMMIWCKVTQRKTIQFDVANVAIMVL